MLLKAGNGLSNPAGEILIGPIEPEQENETIAAVFLSGWKSLLPILIKEDRGVAKIISTKAYKLLVLSRIDFMSSQLALGGECP